MTRREYIKASRANYRKFARELDDLFVSFAAKNPPIRMLWDAWKRNFTMKRNARRIIRGQIRMIKAVCK